MTAKRHLDLLFPTPIAQIITGEEDMCKHYADVILSRMGSTDQEYLKNHREWTTMDNLHTDAVFAPLVNLIDQEVEQYFEDVMGVDSKKDMSMVAMWSNVRLGGSRHHMHAHPNSFFSGVIYLETPDQDGDDPGSIIFADPRPSRYFNADYKADSPLGYRSWWYTPKVGMLMIFPSWLDHGTDDGNFDNTKRRISLSFNYALTQCSKHTMSLNLKNNFQK